MPTLGENLHELKIERTSGGEGSSVKVTLDIYLSDGLAVVKDQSGTASRKLPPHFLSAYLAMVGARMHEVRDETAGRAHG
jgi:hypothetical protein